MSCFWGHQWSQWDPYVSTYGWFDKGAGKILHRVETRQTRTCSVCGKSEDELLCEGRSPLAKREVTT